MVVGTITTGNVDLASKRRSELESTCQTHDVVWVDLTLEFLQGPQIVPIDIDKRRRGLDEIPVQRRAVIGYDPLHLGESREAICRFFHC